MNPSKTDISTPQPTEPKKKEKKKKRKRKIKFWWKIFERKKVRS